MKKRDILKALESVGNSTESNIVAADLIRNIQIFGDEVIVDAESMSPTLQAKKKLEVDIMKAIHDKVAEKAKVYNKKTREWEWSFTQSNKKSVKDDIEDNPNRD